MRTFLILSLIISLNCGIFDIYDCIAQNLDKSPTALKVLELILEVKLFEAISIMLSNVKEYNEVLEICLYGNPDDKPFDENLLKVESEKIVKKLFGFSYNFKSVSLDKEITIYEGNPKITAKLTASYNIDFTGENSGFINIEESTVLNETGVETSFTIDFIEKIKKIYNFNIKDLSLNLERKIKGAIVDGTISFKISLNKIELAFNLKKTEDHHTCLGALIITIYPGIDPPKNPPFYPEVYNDVFVESVKYGAIAAGVIAVIKSSCIFVGKCLTGIAAILLA